MCNLSEGIYEDGLYDGIQKGIQEGILMAIKSIADSLDMTIEKAMDTLKIAEEERPIYMEMLEKK